MGWYRRKRATHKSVEQKKHLKILDPAPIGKDETGRQVFVDRRGRYYYGPVETIAKIHFGSERELVKGNFEVIDPNVEPSEAPYVDSQAELRKLRDKFNKRR